MSTTRRRERLFDSLREIDETGEILHDRPESMWCRQYEEIFNIWEEMGGVPADLSTVEALVQMALTLWRRHKALQSTLDLVADETEGKR